MRLPCRITRRSRLYSPPRERNGGRGPPSAALPSIRPSSRADSGPGGRDQPDLSCDSGSSLSFARKTDPHREAGACPMTVDLSQTPLRYGDAYDELSADGVTPRPHWAHLMESLQAIGPDELGRRWARAERRIRENGITYNIYGDPLGANRAWQIDIVPLLIPAEEWRFIEAGIIQRQSDRPARWGPRRGLFHRSRGRRPIPFSARGRGHRPGTCRLCGSWPGGRAATRRAHKTARQPINF